jgi:hypothetical protein
MVRRSTCGPYMAKSSSHPAPRCDAAAASAFFGATRIPGGALTRTSLRGSRAEVVNCGQRVRIAGQQPAAVGMLAIDRDPMTGHLRRLSAGARGHE